MASAWVCAALLLALPPQLLAEDFSSSCARGCACKWQSGNKAADCAGSALSTVPQLSADIQNLYLNGNPLYELPRRAFQDVGLSNLKKLHARNCHLQTVHRDAFLGLSIMIELDLAHNELKSLAPDTFRATDKIRWIVLNHNLLERLDDHLFRDLRYLQKVVLNDNRLHTIGARAFLDLPKLTILNLASNRLAHVKLESLQDLTALTSLDLTNNTWRCDCALRGFRAWVMQRRLYTSPTSCAEPPQLQGRLWSELDADEFACRPRVLAPPDGAALRLPDGGEASLGCLVAGSPANVSWVFESRVLSARPDGRHRIAESPDGVDRKWVNLTIVNARSSDAGSYRCVAQNAAGVDERKFVATAGGGGGGAVSEPASAWLPLVAGVCVCGAALLLLTALSCWWCLRRRSRDKLNKTGGDALLEGSVIPELEKSVMSGVNPITKPPRRYDTSIASADLTAPDNDSVFGAAGDESRSMELTARADYLRLERAYPPDLLAFRPPVSPASTVSTQPDTARLLPLSPGFRTLPHRSASPARSGYVTIPRRPRAPSWASHASTPVHVLPTAEAQEPLYDNLGVRTTADGSSVLSLNTSGVEPATPAPAIRRRPLPATPDTAALIAAEPLYARPPSWAGTNSLRRKTPPRPPPKPKKKQPESTEPLFEDEGEDGTEV